ncbi:MAG: hypothetical protein ACOZFS_13010 [Thermodesulfobacteriota bacterium]
MQFSIYYHSQAKGDYLRQVVVSSGTGQVRQIQDFSGLGDAPAVDVVLVEYQDNNPQMDNWIAQTTGRPGAPEIFLVVERLSPRILWKALKLGVQELFNHTISAKAFQEATVRVKLRQARLTRPRPSIGIRSGLPGWKPEWEACWGI